MSRVTFGVTSPLAIRTEKAWRNKKQRSFINYISDIRAFAWKHDACEIQRDDELQGAIERVRQSLRAVDIRTIRNAEYYSS